VTTALQLLVEVVEHEVAQEGRKRTALRGPFVHRADRAVFHHPGLERGPDELEHALIGHPLGEPRRLPVILSPEEVRQLLDATQSSSPGGLKYRAALSVAYGAGLRASEVVSLKVSDIDSERMVIRVEQGKGRKDRYAMLSEHPIKRDLPAPLPHARQASSRRRRTMR